MLSDDDSVRAAYDAHGAELYRFCLTLLRDSAQAEDAVQETFVRAWRSRDRFDAARGSLRTWLFSIARNVVVDAHRGRARRPAVVSELHDDMRSLGDHADRVVLAMQLQQGLATLSPDQRFAVTEIAVRGRSSTELASELDTPDSTIRSRLYYGLKSMRAAVLSEGWRDA
jgi:RNA polymerase sigma-70 factor (ECF subfamily)